ncbi:MAG: 6-phosphogluconolactonase [Mangrovibacterium sp.]
MRKKFSTLEAAAAALASHMERLIQAHHKKSFHFALAGGSTPAMLYDLLAQKEEIDWRRTHLWWGDERCVPPSDPQSNYRLAREHLLDKISIPPENIHRIMGELDPPAACQAYEEELKRQFQSEHPAFDLILLGLGEDGHTASLFPHELYLFHADDLCVVATHPESGQRRISFSGTLINAAQQVAFLVGDGKAARLEELFSGKPHTKMPAWHVQPAGKLLFFYSSPEGSLGEAN